MTEERLVRLEERVAALENVVARLHQRPDGAAGPVPARLSNEDDSWDGAGAEMRPTLSASRAMFLLGRSILVLAGGFMLRVLTESGSVPPLAGFTLGMVYSLGLIFVSHRLQAKGNQADAGSIGLTAALIAYPFLFEAIIKLGLVPTVPGGLAVGLVTAAGLGMAWLHRQQFLAWVYCLAALLTILGLGFRSDAPVVFAVLLLLLGGATALLAYTRGWHLKRWPVGLAVNLVFLRLTSIATNPVGVGSGDLAVAATTMLRLDLGLLVLYLGIFCYRALIQGRGVRVFDVIQSALVLAVGFGGAAHIVRTTGHGAGALGWLALIAAVVFYTIAFTTVRVRLGRGRGFFYFASLGLVFLFLGSRVMAPGPWLTWIWLLLGLAMAVLGSRFDRVTLRSHSVIYLALAAVYSGLLSAALDAFAAGAASTWHPLTRAGLTNVAVAMGSYAVFVRRPQHDTDPHSRRVPDFLAAMLSLVGLGSLAIILVTGIMTETPPAANAATVAVIRTAVISLAAVGLALACRRPRLRELGWLVYPLLGAGCLKVIMEDLRQGTPLTLSLAFACLGGALILAPRLLGTGRKARRAELPL